MKHYRIKVTGLAEQDMENAGDYIAYHLLNPSAAVNTVNGFRSQINKLQVLPKRNNLSIDPLLASMGVRMDCYRNYEIYYVVDDMDSTVYIVRILHMLENSQEKLYKTFGL